MLVHVCTERVHELLKLVKERVPPVPSRYMYKLVMYICILK